MTSALLNRIRGTTRAIGVLLALSATAVGAAEPTKALGFALRVDTADTVRARLEADSIPFDSAERNQLTSGPVIRIAGPAFGVDGLSAVALVFDEQGKLVAAHLTLAKHRYPALLETLKAKYRLKDEARPFVGDRYANFVASDGVLIEAMAPHMSFDMSVLYRDASIDDAVSRLQAKEKARAEAAQREQF